MKTTNNEHLKANIFNPPDHNLKDGDVVISHIAPADVLMLAREKDMSSGT